MQRAIAVALGVVTMLVALDARAQASDAEVTRRLIRIERLLAREQPRARTWKTAWLVTYGVLALGQGTFALLTEDRALRADAGVGAVKSGLGFGGLALFP